jgi:hypothetical protein
MSDKTFWDIVMGAMLILLVAFYAKLAACAESLQQIHDLLQHHQDRLLDRESGSDE